METLVPESEIVSHYVMRGFVPELNWIKFSALSSRLRNKCFVKDGSMCANDEVFKGLSSHIFCAIMTETTQIARQLYTVSGIDPMEVILFV